MKARLRKLLSAIGDSFWIIPGIFVVLEIVVAEGLVDLDRSGAVPTALVESAWLYNGGATGARTLLGAIASSTIGVAGTVFSITIAALSLAAGQMGPRLLRNFTRDRGNQVTLGIYLGTFSYALMVLRSVRTREEGEFVPHLSLTMGILLAFVCVATLVFFVNHVAGRINVDTVIELVSRDVSAALDRLAVDEPAPVPTGGRSWRDAVPVTDARRGYLQQLDAEGLADWAVENEVAIRLLVRPGGYVFPGAPIALVTSRLEGVESAIRDATALGTQRVSAADLEFAIRQLVEVAVRALSPGINDPHTAISVLERLGAALCELSSRHLPVGEIVRDGRIVLIVPEVDYAGLTDTMFHLIRQNAAASPAVLIRILEVLTVAASCERRPLRVASLSRHADLVMEDGTRTIANLADLEDLRRRHRLFERVRREGPVGGLDEAV